MKKILEGNRGSFVTKGRRCQTMAIISSRVLFMAIFCIFMLQEIGHSGEENKEAGKEGRSSIDVLEALKGDLLKAFSDFPRENDQKPRQLVIQTAKKKFDSELKESRSSEDALSEQFGRYLNNISQSRIAFRPVEEKYKDATAAKQSYLAAVAKTFWNDVPSASDYSKKEDHCEWFRECGTMYKRAQLLEIGGGSNREASQVYSAIQKLYSQVLKANPSDGNGSAIDNLKANMTYIRSQFPTSTDELKKANGKIAQMLESMAQQQFKMESGSGGK